MSHANNFMAENFKKIPTQAFYTAMPQLIAQIMHINADSASVVQYILKKVLFRFPEQAMWPLAWLCHSKNSKRKQIGVGIFKEAQKIIAKKNKALGNLLMASKNLINHLQSIAT
jgi:hypothetical protein